MTAMDVQMYKAINAGDFPLVKYLLRNGCSSDVILQDSTGKTALIFATIKGHLNILQLLIQFKASVNFKDKYGKTALMYACIYDKCDILSSLISAGADVNMVDSEGRTALLHGAHAGGLKCVSCLCLDHNVTLNQVDTTGQSAIALAACGGHDRCLEFLVKHGPDYINLTDNHGNCPLSQAIHLSKVNEAFILLNNGADVNVKNKEGKTPLTKAFQQNRNDNIFGLILRLLSHGAVPSYTLYDEFFLHEMIARGKPQIVQQMLINGCAPRMKLCKENVFRFNISEPISPLSVALLSNRMGIARYLLANSFFTPFDVHKLSQHRAIMDHLISNDLFRCMSLLRDISSIPWPLVTLALTSLSSLFYQSKSESYENYISVLPPPIKRKLKFQTESVFLCIHEWETIPLMMESGQPCPFWSSVYWPIGHRLRQCQMAACSIRNGYRVDKLNSQEDDDLGFSSLSIR